MIGPLCYSGGHATKCAMQRGNRYTRAEGSMRSPLQRISLRWRLQTHRSEGAFTCKAQEWTVLYPTIYLTRCNKKLHVNESCRACLSRVRYAKYIPETGICKQRPSTWPPYQMPKLIYHEEYLRFASVSRMQITSCTGRFLSTETSPQEHRL